MKTKFIALIILIFAMSSFALTACNGVKTEEAYYQNLSESVVSTEASVKTALEKLNAAETYTYTAEIYMEDLSNFDYENRLMPKEKAQPEDKLWYKPKLTYTYVKSGADSYMKAVFTDMSFEEVEKASGTKIEAVYAQPVTLEVWVVSGTETVKLNGEAISDLSGVDERLTTFYGYSDYAKYALNYYSESDSFKDGIYRAKTAKFFGQRVATYQTYAVEPLLSDEWQYYRNSALASGYGEDLKFDWENIKLVNINTFSVTYKKNTVATIELYNEKIASYHKVTSQVWDGKTVTSWYGDRVTASRAVIEIDYGSRRHPVEIPAL